MTGKKLICLNSTLMLAALMIGSTALSDESGVSTPGVATPGVATPSRHQLMKDCIAKQKAADSGRPGYELTQDCKNITKTEKENADTVKKQADEKPVAGAKVVAAPTPR